MSFPLPPNEPERLKALRQYGLLDTPREPAFDALVALAGYIFQAPVALVSLVDQDRLWFKAAVGPVPKEVTRERGFSSYAIMDAKGLIVEDAAADPRFNPGPAFEMTPPLRFYAGTPLITHEGHALGTICIMDTQPRPPLDAHQMRILETLGHHAMAQIEIRNSFTLLTEALLERSQTEAEAQKALLDHQREMARLGEMKDRFVSLLAHELRNPLASILNAVELLRSPQPEDALEIIEAQVKHLCRLTEDLLDLSRGTRGKLILKKERLDLAEAVRSALRAARASFTKGGQTLEVQIPKEPLWMEADPLRLEQIVSNLLANAAKFTPPGKKVTLSLRTEGDDAVVCVADEGVGIPAEMLERVFEPFVQVPGTGERGGGLGLGLPLVRQLVHLHHGTVKVESAGEGQGCSCTLRLPLVTGMPGAESIPLTDSESPILVPLSPKTQKIVPKIAPKSCRVLIVDDNTEFRETLARLLKHWGHEPLCIGSGASALEKALSFHPSVALVDLNLPGIDGFAVGECLAHRPELAGLRLVAMSGFGEEQERLRAAQAGFQDFALKPIDPVFLRALL